MTLLWLFFGAAVGGGTSPTHGGSLVVVSGALAGMILTYLPTLRFYRLSPLWGLALPVIGAIYLAMTWCSALRYYRRERARWKDRIYA